MVHREYTWMSDDQTVLFGQSWMPAGNPRGVINLIHGFKEHSGRYNNWATRFTENGYGVIAVDLRGHGRSGGRRGYSSSYKSYLRDFRMLLQNSTELFEHVPQVLYGHSLGGNIVINYLISENPLPRAAVVTSPWFTLAYRPSMLKLAAAKTFRYLLPGILLKSDLDADALSHDQQVVEAYLNDPLVHNSISPRLYFEIEEAGVRASRSVYKISIPLLVMHGTADRITSYKATRNFVMNAGSFTTFRDWPDGYHELHNDTHKDEVFNFMLNWLNRQIPDSR